MKKPGAVTQKELESVTEEILRKIESELGMGRGGWDMVNHRELVALAWRHKPLSSSEDWKLPESTP